MVDVNAFLAAILPGVHQQTEFYIVHFVFIAVVYWIVHTVFHSFCKSSESSEFDTLLSSVKKLRDPGQLQIDLNTVKQHTTKLQKLNNDLKNKKNELQLKKKEIEKEIQKLKKQQMNVKEDEENINIDELQRIDSLIEIEQKRKNDLPDPRRLFQQEIDNEERSIKQLKIKSASVCNVFNNIEKFVASIKQKIKNALKEKKYTEGRRLQNVQKLAAEVLQKIKLREDYLFLSHGFTVDGDNWDDYECFVKGNFTSKEEMEHARRSGFTTRSDAYITYVNKELYKTLNEKYKNEFPKGTPLVCLCEEGRVEDVEGMIRGARVAGMDVTAMVSEVGTRSYGDSWTPLMMAAWKEHSTIIEILLQCNADTATTDNNGENALHWAAYNNKTTTTTVQLLLNNMKLEDINHKDTFGYTPLDRCYNYNNSSIKQQLIDLIRQKGGKRKSEL